MTRIPFRPTTNFCCVPKGRIRSKRDPHRTWTWTWVPHWRRYPPFSRTMDRADRKSQVRQCFGFCTADLLSSLAYESDVQKPKYCPTWNFPSALTMEQNDFPPSFPYSTLPSLLSLHLNPFTTQQHAVCLRLPNRYFEGQWTGSTRVEEYFLPSCFLPYLTTKV